ncbi:hypothetical protein DXC26_00595 [Clostridiaceae bacterium OM08-6BH]|nr:hypothetical protein DXC26_00595 [Clostridiaceae bacterium OM08-6BH]
MTALYDLYDESGRLMHINKSAEEFGKLLGVPAELVKYKEKTKTQLLKRYTVKRAKKEVKNLGRINVAELKDWMYDWDEMRKLYRNVKWVRKMESGVIKLKLKGMDDGHKN